jgi:hypothetical protein
MLDNTRGEGKEREVRTERAKKKTATYPPFDLLFPCIISYFLDPCFHFFFIGWLGLIIIAAPGSPLDNIPFRTGLSLPELPSFETIISFLLLCQKD